MISCDEQLPGQKKMQMFPYNLIKLQQGDWRTKRASPQQSEEKERALTAHLPEWEVKEKTLKLKTQEVAIHECDIYRHGDEQQNNQGKEMPVVVPGLVKNGERGRDCCFS